MQLDLLAFALNFFSSVLQLCLSLCNAIDCSMPGFSIHCQLPELAQAHDHRLGDAIQPSHPLFPLPLLPSVFPRIRVFTIIIDCVAETAPDLPGLSALELEPSLEFCA